MELAYTETLGPVIPDLWRGSTSIPGPGVFVFIVNCPLDDTATMQVQVFLDAEGAGDPTIVEDVTSTVTDLSSAAAFAGFQSAPVPLVDGTWTAAVRAKHDDATVADRTMFLRVVKL